MAGAGAKPRWVRRAARWCAIPLAISGLVAATSGPVRAQTLGSSCTITAETGGPWGPVYNQKLSVNNATGATLNGVRVRVTFPAGHSYRSGWNPSLPTSGASSVEFDVPGSFGAGISSLSSGFNVDLTSAANASARPTFLCGPLGSTLPGGGGVTGGGGTGGTGSASCTITAETGGPWGPQYSQKLSVNNTSGSALAGVHVVVTFPAGHTYKSGWNPSLATSGANVVEFDVLGSIPTGSSSLSSGFNVAIADGANASARPTYACSAAGTVAPTTAPPTTAPPTTAPPTTAPPVAGTCTITAVTGGPWGPQYSQQLSITNTGSPMNGVQVTVNFPAGHSYKSGWNPSLAASGVSSLQFDIPGTVPTGTSSLSSGFNVTIGSGADASARPTYGCAPVGTTSSGGGSSGGTSGGGSTGPGGVTPGTATAGTIRLNAAAAGQSFTNLVPGQNLHPFPGTRTYENPKFRTRANQLSTNLRFAMGIGAQEWGWANCETGPFDPNTGGWLSGNVPGASPCTTSIYYARLRDFMRFAAQAGTANTVITLNVNVTKEESAAMVAYVTGLASDTRAIGTDRNGADWRTVGYWAQLRDNSGTPRLNTTNFEFGNEVYGGGRNFSGAKGCSGYGWEVTYTCDPSEFLFGATVNGVRYDGYVATRAALKNLFPSVRVGLSANGPGDFGSATLTEDMVRLARNAGATIDYLMVHPYFYYQLGTLSDEQVFALAQDKAAELETFYNGLFSRVNGGVRIPVQMTEWNLSSGAPQDSKDYMNAQMGALSAADFVGRISEMGFVEGMNFGDMITGQFGTNYYGAIRAEDSNSFVRNPSYFSFMLWNRFGSQILPVASGFDRKTQLAVYAGKKSDTEFSLYVINKSGSTTNATISLDGVTSISTATLDTLTSVGNQLNSKDAIFNGVAETSINDAATNAPSTSRSVGAASFVQSFAPHSITLVRLNVQR
jgi:hypothetical protein